jgi:flagellar hook assembly protein FlgD
VYQARFRGQVFLSGTTFGVALAKSSLPGVEQVASEGDATGLIASQSLVAVADVAGHPLLDRVAARPAVFSPNGDGINDETAVEFAVYRLVGEERFEIEIFDLLGRPVRSLSVTRANPSGTHAIPWDGRDDQGRVVPPGHYLARVRFEADAAGRQTQAVCLVAVAY